MKIRIVGDPVLREKSEPVVKFDESLEKTVADMVATMLENDGIGLAAPQVGISKRFLIIGMPVEGDNDKRNIFVLINPEILEHGEETVVIEEGCLSFPELTEEVKRFDKIRVRYQDVKGETHEANAVGLFSRVIQHETDHLDGILFIDHLTVLKRSLLRGKIKRIQKEHADMNKKA